MATMRCSDQLDSFAIRSARALNFRPRIRGEGEMML